MMSDMETGLVTDKTKCPHCGAGKSPEYRQLRFDCGTIMCDNEVARSSQCELKTLRAKVAAQQELLEEAAESLRLLHHWSDVATHMGHATLIACRENAAEVLRKLEANK